MANQNRIPVTVCGQSFVLKADEDRDRDYIRILAHTVDEKLKELRKNNPSLTPAKAGILLCLELQDQQNKMHKDYNDLTEELDKIDLI